VRVKVNKQGVRDLSYIQKRQSGLTQEQIVEGARPSFGKNEMPGELASALLTKAAYDVAEYGAKPEPVVEEFLQILAEECAETVQRITKILRFGIRRNPWDGKDNIERLESEIGDICAALDVLSILKIVDPARIGEHEKRKLQAFAVEENPARPRIRHMTADLRDLLHQYLCALDETP
jgi:hypothetical protein